MVKAHGHRRGGYTLIVCVIAITLLSIAVATALPLVSGQIKREKEAELVFRGMQYAEAIRVFQRRFGRPPATLDELMEVRPRSIRQLWKDPMTEDGKWVVLVSGVQPPPQGQGQNPPPNPAPGGDTAEENDLEGTQQPGAPVGPIIGVRSRLDKEGMRTFFGANSYGAWRFTVDLLTVRPPGAEGLPGIPRAAWIGKAFPEGVAAKQPPSTIVPQQPKPRPPGGKP
jgi:type II secretory pathway pseudopilin PulG